MFNVKGFFGFSMVAAMLAALINSSISNQTTTVPLAYRAIVGIVLIVVCIFLFYKFFKFAIAGLFAIIILLILLSTTYYFLKTGTFSISESLQFLSSIYSFFAGSHSAIIANAINSSVGKVTPGNAINASGT